MRSAVIHRKTNETDVNIKLNLDGGGLGGEGEGEGLTHASQHGGGQSISVNTGIGFLDHMLHALAKHGGWSLLLTCKGDLYSML